MADAINKDFLDMIRQNLNGALSPELRIRQSCEERLHVLQELEEFGVHLAEIAVNVEEDVSIRQLSSVILKRFVDAHWTDASDNYRPPMVSDIVKAAIKKRLPLGLTETSSRVQSSIAYVISAIAHLDWPKEWPELFDNVMTGLSSENKHVVRGTLLILREFSADISDNQIPFIAPVILPQLLEVLENDSHDVLIRTKAAEVFHLLALILTSSSQLKKTYLDPVLPAYCAQFLGCIMKKNEHPLKVEVFRALALLVRRAPKQVAHIMPDLLSTVWQLMVYCSEQYLQYFINDTEGATCAEVGLEGNMMDVRAEIESMYDLIFAILDDKKYHTKVKSVLPDLIYYLIRFMQITSEQEQVWGSNVGRFMEDVYMDSYGNSLRGQADELIMNLCKLFDDNAYSALSNACMRHIQESLTGTHLNSWKVREACMHAVYSTKEIIAKKQTQGDVTTYDLHGFLENVVVRDISQPVSPLQLAQCILVGARYTDFMQPEMIKTFLDATLNALQPDQSHVLKISALRAIPDFCENLKECDKINLLLPMLGSFIKHIFSMDLYNSIEVLSFALETTKSILNVDERFTSTYSRLVVDYTATVFFNHTSDEGILSMCQDMFMELAQNPVCLEHLFERLLPTVASTLSTPEIIPKGLGAVGIDILTTLIGNSKPPLNDDLINIVFPGVCHFITKTPEIAAMRNVGECVRAFIGVSPDQIWNYQDSDGHTGLTYALQVVTVLLDPTHESIASSAGRLLITLMIKAGERMDDRLGRFLRMILTRMHSIDSLDVAESLYIVYAHVFNTNLEAALTFLSMMDEPDGQTALHFLLETWCNFHPLFFGSFENKVSIMGLCNVLKHGVTENDARLVNMIVKGDVLHDLECVRGPKTRSQASKEPVLYVDVPVLARILKLLVKELALFLEEQQAKGTSDEETDEDSDAEGDVDDFMRDENPFFNREFLDAMRDDDDLETDPELLREPLYQFNVHQYIIEFLRSICTLPGFSVLLSQIGDIEKEVLKTMKII